jgi:hypothetical protein
MPGWFKSGKATVVIAKEQGKAQKEEKMTRHFIRDSEGF